MKMNLKVTGFEEVSVGLRNIAEKAKNDGARTIRRGAARIEKKAKQYAPRDLGNLEASIRSEKSLDERNRVRYTVTAGGSVNGVNVDQYVYIIHEHYESILGRKDGKGGPSRRPGGTLDKMAKYPGKVGSGFLTRAAAEEEEFLRQEFVQLVSLLDIKL